MSEPDQIDTSDEACAVACMLVSNPYGALQPGWQKRVNDLIRALRDERNSKNAEIERLTKELVNARANSVSRGKMLLRLRNNLINIRDELDDQEDLVAFGSTNHADQFRDAVQELDSFKWDMIIREKDEDDLLAACAAKDARIEQLENTLKLHAGDCMSLSNEIDQMRRNAEDDAAALSTANSEIERLKAEMAKSARDTEQARTVRDIFSDSLQRIRKENADLSFKLEQIVKVMDEREGTPSYLAALETENARLCEDNVRLNAKVGIGVTVGGGHIVYGSHEAIKRVQHIIMIDSTHPIEKEDVRRSLLRQVQAAEARITSLKRELETLRGTALSEADKSLGVLEDECEQNRMSFVQTRNSESAQLALFERNILKRARSIVRSLMEVDAPIPNTPSQQLVRHKKRGSTYHVIGRGELQSVFPIEQGTPLVAYQGEADGRVWIRPAVEFDDGRFEKIEVRDV